MTLSRVKKPPGGIVYAFTVQSKGMRFAGMSHLSDEKSQTVAAVRVVGYISCPIEFTNIVAVPRSEDCLNGRSRCGITGSLIPKRLNGIANEHDPTPRVGPPLGWSFNRE